MQHNYRYNSFSAILVIAPPSYLFAVSTVFFRCFIAFRQWLFSCCALLFLLLLAEPLKAQHGIQGAVTDKAGRPVSFATILLQQVGDTIVAEGATTDTFGRYHIIITHYPVLLKATVVGYLDKGVLLKDTTQVTVNFTLEETSVQLGGVSVRSRKPVFERRADRTIFNVESSVSAVGNDALEVLKRAPGIRVTDDGISIAGKSTVNVMINDKLVQLSGNELTEMLKSIPAENLARIEVITAPPAKYDAAGNAGLVNIVLKRQLRNGLNGQVTGSYNQHTYNGGGLNGTFNYRQGKLNIFGTGNAFKGREKNESLITSFYPDEELVQNKAGISTNVFDRGNIGADYNLTPNMIIGALYTHGYGSWRYATDDHTTTSAYQLLNHTIDSLIQTSAQTRDRGNRNVYNLNWEWKPDTTGKKISADADWFHRTGVAAQSFTTNDFFEDGASTGFQSTNRNAGTQVIDIRTGKIDAEWPTRIARLSFGGKLSFIHNISNNQFQVLDGGTFKDDTSKTNAFDYKENTQALYFSAQQTYGKWELQAGLRGEYTQTRGYSPTNGQLNTNNYIKLFPTVYAQYHYNDNNIIGISYSRRIERPDFWIMNPFRSYSTLTSYESGNPYLQPSFTHNIELNYTWHNNYTIGVFAERISDYFARYSYLDTATQGIIFSQANLGTAGSYGFSFSGNTTVTKWWELNIQLRGYHSLFHSSFNNATTAYSNTAFSADVNCNFILNKNKTFLAEAGGQFTSSQLSDFDIQKPIGSATFGLKWLLCHGRLITGINLEDAFRTNRSILRNQLNGTLQSSYGDDQNLHFAITWKFGNNGIKSHRERTATEETQRAR